MTYTDKQIRAFLRSVQLEGWAESTPHIRGVGMILEALREPTGEMVEAGRDELTGRGRNPVGGDAEAVWQAMLDARMGEG